MEFAFFQIITINAMIVSNAVLFNRVALESVKIFTFSKGNGDAVGIGDAGKVV